MEPDKDPTNETPPTPTETAPTPDMNEPAPMSPTEPSAMPVDPAPATTDPAPMPPTEPSAMPAAGPMPQPAAPKAKMHMPKGAMIVAVVGLIAVVLLVILAFSKK